MLCAHPRSGTSAETKSNPSSFRDSCERDHKSLWRFIRLYGKFPIKICCWVFPLFLPHGLQEQSSSFLMAPRAKQKFALQVSSSRKVTCSPKTNKSFCFSLEGCVGCGAHWWRNVCAGQVTASLRSHVGAVKGKIGVTELFLPLHCQGISFQALCSDLMAKGFQA